MKSTARAVNLKKTLEKTGQPDGNKNLNSRSAWTIWLCAGIFYLYECILRVSPSVMTEGLMHDFSVTSASLGILASFYYYSYTPLQIPCGALVDLLGTRRIITASAAICTLGTFIFASSQTLFWAKFGRFLVGAGSACAFISCLKISAEWFTPAKFALMAGITNIMGTVGGTFGGPPLAWLVNNRGGWRQASLFLGFIGLGMIVFSWLMIRDRPRQSPEGRAERHPAQEISLKKSLILLMVNPQVWLIAIFGSLMWLPIAAFAELWGVPYLMHAYGINNEYASMATVMIFIGFALGSPLAAWISDRFQSRLLAMNLSAFALLALFLVILFGPKISLPLMFGLLFIAGICNGGQVLAFTCVKEISSKRISGTAIGFTNCIVMMSGVIFQPLLGELLDWCWDGNLGSDGVRIYSEAAYQAAMIAVPAGIALSWLILQFVKETYHKH